MSGGEIDRKAEREVESKKLLLDQARLIHGEHDKMHHTLMGGTFVFGSETLKAAALVNGGAAAALLTFIGAARHEIKPELVTGLKSFSLGLLLAASATGVSYLGQYLYTIGHAYKSKHWEDPVIRDTPFTKRIGWAAITLHVFSCLMVLVAYGVAVYGFREAASAIVTRPAASSAETTPLSAQDGSAPSRP